jgi:GC-rich sequence DNA-binding factor
MDSPVVFKRKGTAAKPVQRVRERSPTGTGTEDVVPLETGAEESPSTLATKLRKKVQRSKPKSKLSFGGDDEVRFFMLFQLCAHGLN